MYVRMTKKAVRSLVIASHSVEASPPNGPREDNSLECTLSRWKKPVQRIGSHEVVNEVDKPQSYRNALQGIARDCQTERLLSISLSVLCGPKFWLGRITDDKVAGRAFSGAVQQSQEVDIMSQEVGIPTRLFKPESLSSSNLLISTITRDTICPIILLAL